MSLPMVSLPMMSPTPEDQLYGSFGKVKAVNPFMDASVLDGRSGQALRIPVLWRKFDILEYLFRAQSPNQYFDSRQYKDAKSQARSLGKATKI